MTFSHAQVYHDNHKILPKVFCSPSKYIQGPQVLEHLGQYLTQLFQARSIGVIISSGGEARVGRVLHTTFKEAQIKYEMIHFEKECSYEEAARLTDAFRPFSLDCIVALGGGKLIDCEKMVAYKLQLPLIVCSSLASNDGPCSALSGMYQPNGAYIGVEYYPMSPAVVVVDLQVLVHSPVRTFAAGMGDAMATYYEAQTCYDNPAALSMLHARPTITAMALAKLCRDTLLQYGAEAVQSCKNHTITPAFENVVEANTLLSGLGFESGGLASAHAIAQGLTAVPYIESTYMHGEMVAIGLLTMLILQQKLDEYHIVATFFTKIGLPIHFQQLQLDLNNTSHMSAILAMIQKQWLLKNEQVDTSSNAILQAMQQVHQHGLQLTSTT